MASAVLSAEERRRRDKRIGIVYSAASAVFACLLVFCAFHFGEMSYGAQSVLKGMGIPLSDEESAEVLQDGYDRLDHYEELVSSYAERFGNEINADSETREILRQDLTTLANELVSTGSEFYWLQPGARSVSYPYRQVFANMETCRRDLRQYFLMLLDAVEVSLDYSAPYSKAEQDEIWAPIAAGDNSEGENAYLSEYYELCPASNPSTVKVG